MQRMHAVYFFHLGLSIGDLVIAHFVLFAAFYWKNDRNHTLRVWIWGIFTILTWSILLLDILRVFGIGGKVSPSSAACALVLIEQ